MNTETGKCEIGYEPCSNRYSYENGKYICDSCNDGFARGETVCKDCKETNKYCKILEEDDCLKCKECYEGAVLNATTFICEVTPEYYENNEEERCMIGYTNISGICQKGHIKDCVYYDPEDGEKCAQCLKGGIVQNDTCTDVCNVEGCDICDPYNPNICVQCKVYKEWRPLPNGKCVQWVENCWYCGILGKCETCENGYGVDDNGNCEPCKLENCMYCDHNSSECENCYSGYGYSDTNKTCVKCIDNCDDCYNPDSGKCDNCFDGYVTSSDGKKCIKRVFGCDIHFDNGTCSQCKRGYELEDGQCVTDGCEIKIEDKCVKCISNYYDSDYYFMKEDFTCGKCDDSCNESNGCISDSKTCEYLPRVTECDKYDENLQCVKCDSDFPKDKDGECEEYSDYGTGCYEYSPNGQCLVCLLVNQTEGKYTSKYEWPAEDGECYIPKKSNGDNSESNSNGDNKPNDDAAGRTQIIAFALMILFFIAF